MSVVASAPYRLIASARPLAKWLAVVPLALVTLALLAPVLLFPGPPHLSLRASQGTGGNFVVDHVVAGGTGWDAGIRPGDIVTSHEGGDVSSGDRPSLSDPLSSG